MGQLIIFMFSFIFPIFSTLYPPPLSSFFNNLNYISYCLSHGIIFFIPNVSNFLLCVHFNLEK